MSKRHYILLVASLFTLAMHLGCASPARLSRPPWPIQNWVTLPEDKPGYGTPSFHTRKALSYLKAKHPDLDVQRYQLKYVGVLSPPEPAGIVKVVYEGERRWSTGRWSYPQAWVFMNPDGSLREIELTTVGYMKPITMKEEK